MVLGGTVVAGLAIVAVRDPNASGSYGYCPFKALTGWDCPFCGGLRGTYALLHGEVATALDHNILVPFFLTGLVLLLWATWRGWRLAALTGRRAGRIMLGVTAAVLVVFWVARNLPGLEYLFSTA